MSIRKYKLAIVLALCFCVSSCMSRSSNEALWQISLAEDERLIPLDKLDLWIASPDTTVRARIAYAIGIVGQNSGFDRLRTLLKDENPTVLRAAAFAAGQLADSNSVEALLTLSTFENETTRRSALEALSKIGTDAASARLSNVLNDTGESIDTRALTAQWMFRLKDSTSQSALIAQAMSDNAVIREKVFYSLSRRSVKDAQPVFLLGLNDPIEQIQIFSINGLSRINDTSAAALVQPLLLSKNPRVQYYAVNFMAKFSVSASMPLILNLTNTNADPYVRIAAVQALAKFKSDQSALRLMELLTDSDINVASAALVSYAAQNRPDRLKFAGLFASDPDSRKRIAAVQAFGTIANDTARTMLKSLFTDPVPSVRGEALDQIFTLKDSNLTNLYIEQALSDSDYMPVAIAANQIATARLMNFVPRICALYNQTQLIENRQSALDALLELADSVADRSPLADIAKSAMIDDSFGLRQRGRALAAKCALPVPIEPDRFESALSRPIYDAIYTNSHSTRVKIATSRGDIVIELHPQIAPKTVANYLALVSQKFYDNRIWHRVVPDFVVQDGCPRGDGWGGPGYEIRCEYNRLPFLRGTVGMATSGKDTGGSQYFICQSAQPHLDGRYTVFGQVISGMEIVDQIQLGDSIRTVTELHDGE